MVYSLIKGYWSLLETWGVSGFRLPGAPPLPSLGTFTKSLMVVPVCPKRSLALNPPVILMRQAVNPKLKTQAEAVIATPKPKIVNPKPSPRNSKLLNLNPQSLTFKP